MRLFLTVLLILPSIGAADFVKTLPDPVVALSGGSTHSCAVKASGSVWCWGYNLWGVLGDGTKARQRTTPVKVMGLEGAVSISGGTDYTCVVSETHQAWCWGYNSHGMLGDGTKTTRPLPVQVKGIKGIRKISTGYQHACAITVSDEAWCWGHNYTGQLGTGDETSTTFPVRVAHLGKVRDLAAGDDSTCAVTADGIGWCWGINSDGQLGNGTLALPYNVPDRVIHFDNIDSLSLSSTSYHACARQVGGEPWCWGRNVYGELGRGEADEGVGSPHPRRVLYFDTTADIAVGSRRTCAIDRDQQLWCWGYNRSGQLGDGTTVNRLHPTKIDSSEKFTYISLGREHTCGKTTSGEVYCWGYGSYGQLGNGTTTENQLTPVKVLFP